MVWSWIVTWKQCILSCRVSYFFAISYSLLISHKVPMHLEKGSFLRTDVIGRTSRCAREPSIFLVTWFHAHPFQRIMG